MAFGNVVPKFKKTTTSQLEKKVKKVTKKVDRIYSSIEQKVISTLTDAGLTPIVFSGVVNASPIVRLLNGMIRGDEQGERIGEKACFRKLEMGLQFYSLAPSVSQAQFRVMIVKEGSTALGSDVSYTGLFGTATPAPNYTRNYSTRNPHRYSVLFDKTFLVSPYRGENLAIGYLPNMSTPSSKVLMIDKKMNIASNYARSNAGTVADIEAGTISLLIFTDNSIASAYDVYMTYNLHYDDL